MYRTVRLTKYLRAPDQSGGSKPKIFEAEDGQEYLVKFKENEQGVRVLANDLIANAIAQRLEVACPEGLVVDLDQALLEVNSAFKYDYPTAISPGKHFGIRVIDDILTFPPRSLIRTASNKKEIAKFIILDVLTQNHDRNPRSSVLLVKPRHAPSQFQVSAIDHGHCFGKPNWDESITKMVGNWAPTYLAEFADEIRGKEPFKEGLEKLATLTDTHIDMILDGVPDEWGVPSIQAQALKKFLKSQRDQMADILHRNRHRFPLWK